MNNFIVHLLCTTKQSGRGRKVFIPLSPQKIPEPLAPRVADVLDRHPERLEYLEYSGARDSSPITFQDSRLWPGGSDGSAADWAKSRGYF